MRYTICAVILFFCHIGFTQKVGIGTVTPTNKLSVVGNADITGNVGIGTNVPAKKLVVSGGGIRINGLTIGRGGNNLDFNTAFGVNALASNTSGVENTASGYLSMTANTTGMSNVGLGAYALSSNTTGNGNTAIGMGALQGNTLGSLNTAIGANAGVSTGNLTNSTAIGANTVVSASNSMVLGNNANVGIGTSTPSAKLEVVGKTKTTNLMMTSGANTSYVLTSDASGNASWINFASLETDPKVGALSANKIPKWNGSMLTDGLLYDDGTNLGLGTTSPIAKLDIRATNAGIRILSGGTGSGNHTSFQIGRTATDGTWGVAAINNNYASGTLPGDVILRNESLSQKLILNSGSGNATLVISNGNVGIGTTTMVNRLDIEGGLGVGASYSGSIAAPLNGAIIQGNVGIGTSTPNGTLHVVAPISKTNTTTTHISFFSTNESVSDNPFALRFSLTGGATLDDRYAQLQTTDVNLADGGTLALQENGGNVGIGTGTPGTTLDVEGGIRTKYSGSVVINVDAFWIFGAILNYDLALNPSLPSGWDYTNTAVFVTLADGIDGSIYQAKLTDSGTIQIKALMATTGDARFNWIVLKL